MVDSRTWGRYTNEARLAPEHRIFVNRNLRMETIRVIGFDLDHTLAHYRGPEVEELAYHLTRERLVSQLGYPRELLQVPYDRSFVIRGLVIDKRRGNILKMNSHNYVARGFHGLRALEVSERKAVYRTGRIRMGSGAYVAVDTLFHLPEVYLYLVLVDILERGRGSRRMPRSFARIYEDVRTAIDSVHADGSLKNEIVDHLDVYIRKDPRLVPTLRELSRAGKKLFLLTNSEYFYTDALLRFLANGRNGGRESDWRRLFDLVIVDARKPGFFTDLGRKARAADVPGSPCPVFHGGSARFLENHLGWKGDDIIYFGDHTYGDILRSKKTLGWRTAMVVEELEEELEVTRKIQPQIEELGHWKALRGVLEADVSSLEVETRRVERRLDNANGSGDPERLKRRLEALEREHGRLRAELETVQRMTATLGDVVNENYNSRWGPLFREGQEVSRFGHQVKDFACIYMTRVSNLLYYEVGHYFRSAAERMPHELI